MPDQPNAIDAKLPLLIIFCLIPTTAAMYFVSFVAPIAVGIALTAVVTASVCAVSMAFRNKVQDNANRRRSYVKSFLDRQVQRGKRLAIVDPETTLLKRWYFDLRLSEELIRRKRYGSAITVMAIERLDKLDDDDASRPTRSELDFVQVLTRGVRALDFATKVGDGRYCICLPQTDSVGARAMALRLAREIGYGSVAIGLNEYDPADGDAPPLLERAFACAEPLIRYEAPAPLQVRRLEYSELLHRVRQEEYGELPVTPDESARVLKTRLRKAAKSAGVDLHLSESDGSVRFQRLARQPETSVA